jgi:hypothetical protein
LLEASGRHFGSVFGSRANTALALLAALLGGPVLLRGLVSRADCRDAVAVPLGCRQAEAVPELCGPERILAHDARNVLLAPIFVAIEPRCPSGDMLQDGRLTAPRAKTLVDAHNEQGVVACLVVGILRVGIAAPEQPQ